MRWPCPAYDVRLTGEVGLNTTARYRERASECQPARQPPPFVSPPPEPTFARACRRSLKRRPRLLLDIVCAVRALFWPVGRGNPCATVCWTGRGTSTLRNRSRRGATPARCRPIELALPWQAVTACRREQARCVAGPWRQTVSASAITPKSLSPIRASDEWRRCRYTPTWEGLELTLERRKKLQLFSLAALGL